MIRHRGVSLMEYGLIGSAVIVVCIVGLTIVGGNFQKFISGFKGSMKGDIHSAQTAQMAQAAAKTAAVAAASAANSGVTPATGGSGYGGLSSEMAVTLGKYYESGDHGKMVQTVGANGTTDFLADQITAQVQQMVAEGKLTQAQADIFTQLSNVGHQMADIQGMIEDQAKVFGSDKYGLEKYVYTYNGKQYTNPELGDLASSGSFNADYAMGAGYGPATMIDYANRKKGDGGPIFQNFVNLYYQAQAAGALKDPAFKSTIDNLTSEILVIAATTSVQTNPNEAPNPGVDIQANIAKAAAEYGKGLGSSKLDAVGICTTSGNNDSGTHCTG